MIPGERWQVVVHNDDHNTFALVHHVLRTVCGHDDARARTTTLEIHGSGKSVVGSYDRVSAEATTLRLLRLGLRAAMGEQR
ncbi:ATP-dependent Clp protease adaptor ClpS [Lentzea sp. CA-135723]|uniref:ATP-dependent Clp protease adaptor ClpS n=1 Tax=Lentzea sp. CA-135723 TaxID=3239950 RepID=UPI003D8CDDEE